MNKRDLEANFRVKETNRDGSVDTYYTTGREIFQAAHSLDSKAQSRNNGWTQLKSNASLRACMKFIAKEKGLRLIETRRHYEYQIGWGVRKDGSQGLPRRHERLADPIFEFGRGVNP